MTVLNFPSTTGQPTDGSFTYTENGVIYTWNGSYWAANNAENLDSRYVNVDGDTMTGDLTVPSLNGGPLAGFRNQIINGGYYHWQRNSGGMTISSPSYPSDRWYVNTAVSVVVRNLTSDTTSIPAGFTHPSSLPHTLTTHPPSRRAPLPPTLPPILL